MKIENHINDKKSYELSIQLLLKNNPVKHRKLIVEGCVLASANMTNLVLHLLNKIRQDTDIKHNRLEGFILRNKPFGEKSFEISKSCRNLEDLKYRVVHGSSVSASDVKKAVEQYSIILKKLEEISPDIKKFIGEKNE